MVSVSGKDADTMTDMADALAEIPAKDIKTKDDTAKVLGETVFKTGVENVEDLQAEDPFLEQPVSFCRTSALQLKHSVQH